MRNKFLSICIPTYNRPETLSKLLNQLSDEVLTDVEIRISDDASPDKAETEKMVKNFIKAGVPICYNRNQINLGYSLNVKKLYESAKAEYVWFLCDDDQIVEGCVDKLISKLKRYKPTVSIFNCEWIDSFGRSRKAWNFNDSIVVDHKQLLTYQPIMRTTFLSIGVYKKLVKKINISSGTVKDNIFIQLSLALILLSKKFSIAQFSDHVVRRKVGYKYGEFVKFLLVDHLKAVTAVEHNFEIKKFIEWSHSMFFTFVQVYLSQKVGLFSYNGTPSGHTNQLFKKYYGSSRYYFFEIVKLIYKITPVLLAKILYFLIILLIHGSKAVTVYKNMVNRSVIDSRKTLFNTYT